MKRIIVLTFSLLYGSVSFCQYQFEWKEDLSGKQLFGKHLVCSQTGSNKVTSELFNFDSFGNFKLLSSSTKYPYTDLKFYGGSIYMFDYANIFKYDTSGQEISRYPLYYLGDSTKKDYLYPGEVNIIGDHFYGINYYNLYKYDLKGNFKWILPLEGSTDMLRQSGSNLYLKSSPVNSSSFLYKYDTTGNLIWKVPTGLMLNNMVTDSSGNCYLLGGGNYVPCSVRKIGPDGNLLWSKSLDGLWVTNGYVHGDSLYLCGMVSSYPNDPGSDDAKALFEVLSADSGAKGSKVIYNLNPMTDGNREIFTHIVADDEGVYCGGTWGGEYPKAYLVKFSRKQLTTEIPEQPLQHKTSWIFPNPSSDIVTLKLEALLEQDASAEVYDQWGRRLCVYPIPCSEVCCEHTLPLQNIAKGVYYLKLVFHDGSYQTHKIVRD